MRVASPIVLGIRMLLRTGLDALVIGHHQIRNPAPPPC